MFANTFPQVARRSQTISFVKRSTVSVWATEGHEYNFYGFLEDSATNMKRIKFDGLATNWKIRVTVTALCHMCIENLLIASKM